MKKRPRARRKKWPLKTRALCCPTPASTKMIVTMNARSLNNFFRHRCCQRAQWEIRELADEMLRLVNARWPLHCLRAAGRAVCIRRMPGGFNELRYVPQRCGKKYAFLKGDEMV